jgi:hypothetical protein
MVCSNALFIISNASSYEAISRNVLSICLTLAITLPICYYAAKVDKRRTSTTQRLLFQMVEVNSLLDV